MNAAVPLFVVIDRESPNPEEILGGAFNSSRLFMASRPFIARVGLSEALTPPKNRTPPFGMNAFDLDARAEGGPFACGPCFCHPSHVGGSLKLTGPMQSL